MTARVSWGSHPAADLFPLLSGQELAELAADIRANGLAEPVWLYDDREHGAVILDGRNRVAACEQVGVEVRTRMYTGGDPVGFVVSLNLKRRHLTEGQKAMVALRVQPLYAAEAAKRKAQAVDQPRGAKQSSLEADRPQETFERSRAPQARDLAAKTVGTSGRSVARARRVTEDAPDLAEQVIAGTIALDRAERIIRDRCAEKKRIAQAKAASEARPERAITDIRHGDFRDVLANLRDVDAIITDPPYNRESLPLLTDLAVWADTVLKPDGVLAVLFGQAHLPEVYRLLDGRRPYRWTGCYLAKGQAAQVFGRAQVQTMWKPILFYGGGPRFSDLFETAAGNTDARNNHEWGQDYTAFHSLVERLTSAGQTVADPFLGSGTTLLAAHALGRNAVGCDVEPEHVATSLRRLL